MKPYPPVPLKTYKSGFPQEWVSPLVVLCKTIQQGVGSTHYGNTSKESYKFIAKFAQESKYASLLAQEQSEELYCAPARYSSGFLVERDKREAFTGSYPEKPVCIWRRNWAFICERKQLLYKTYDGAARHEKKRICKNCFCKHHKEFYSWLRNMNAAMRRVAYPA